MKQMILLLTGLSLVFSLGQAWSYPYGGRLFDAKTFYKQFLHPTYYGRQLSWCNQAGKQCGKTVADNYCHRMGYLRAKDFKIAYDIGQTRYLSNNQLCNSYSCDGFQSISCLQRHDRQPPAPYHYRRYTFNFPRYDHHRVAWCYSAKGQCGSRAAYSFCRQVGYKRALNFKKTSIAGITQRLGSKQLCIGPRCDAFKQITCFR